MNKKYYMIDLDGTIYAGENVLPYAKEFIQYLRLHNYPYMFFTNSPQRSKEELYTKLIGMDIDVNINDFYSTSDVVLRYIKTDTIKIYSQTNIYILGSKSLKRMFIENGFNVVEDNTLVADYVIVGYDISITIEDCNIACRHILNGAKVISTNLDKTIPTEKGIAVHTGAIVALLEHATGKKVIDMGKPTQITLDFVLDTFGCNKQELITVGDNLSTDISLAVDNDIEGYLLLTGLTTIVDYNENTKFNRYNKLKVYPTLEYLLNDMKG